MFCDLFCAGTTEGDSEQITVFETRVSEWKSGIAFSDKTLKSAFLTR
jgi:hypothetical protein